MTHDFSGALKQGDISTAGLWSAVRPRTALSAEVCGRSTTGVPARRITRRVSEVAAIVRGPLREDQVFGRSAGLAADVSEWVEWAHFEVMMSRALRRSCVLLVMVFATQSRPAADPVFFEARIRDLRSPESVVRRSAALALGESGDRSVAGPLAKALSDQDAGVRREAAKALGCIRDPAATQQLIGALSDGDANVRFYAAHALGEIKDARAAGGLLRALRDADWNVRNQAAWSLRELRDRTVMVGAMAAIRDAAADVALIGWLIKQTDASGAVAPLAAMSREGDAGVRERAVRVLGGLGPTAAEPLLAALGDGDIIVRRAALAGLGTIGGREIAGALRAFAGRERDAALRQAAAAIADRLAPPRTPGAHWSFDGEDPGKDVTGRGTDGKVTDCTTAGGRVGTGLDFAGKGCVELGRPGALPTGDQPITVMAWIKARGPDGVIVARGGAFCGYSLYIKEGLARFGTKRTADDQAPVIVVGPSPVVGDWAHVAGVIGKDRLELYVNGKLVGTAKTEGPLPGNCGQGMEIGFDAGNSAVEICDHFDGVIDEVKVFQEALDGACIAEEAGR